MLTIRSYQYPIPRRVPSGSYTLIIGMYAPRRKSKPQNKSTHARKHTKYTEHHATTAPCTGGYVNQNKKNQNKKTIATTKINMNKTAQPTPRSMPVFARRNCNCRTLPASSCSDTIVPGLEPPSSAMDPFFLARAVPFFPPPLTLRLLCKRLKPPSEPLTSLCAWSSGCNTAEEAEQC